MAKEEEVTEKEARVLALILDARGCLTCSGRRTTCRVPEILVSYLPECKTLQDFLLIGSGCSSWRRK